MPKPEIELPKEKALPTDRQIERIVKALKRGDTFTFDHMTYAMASSQIRTELLDAIEPVLRNTLNLACGDITLMTPEEHRLLDVYGSWDRENRGNRKTVAEIIEEAKDDTWSSDSGDKNG